MNDHGNITFATSTNRAMKTSSKKSNGDNSTNKARAMSADRGTMIDTTATPCPVSDTSRSCPAPLEKRTEEESRMMDCSEGAEMVESSATNPGKRTAGEVLVRTC